MSWREKKIRFQRALDVPKKVILWHRLKQKIGCCGFGLRMIELSGT